MTPTEGAGASARREYERRRSADARRRWTHLPTVVGVATVEGLVAGALVVGVAAGIDRWLQPAAGLTLPAGLVGELALAAALAVAVGAVVGPLRRPAHTEAWALGATGEQVVGAALAPLADRDWVLFHDRRLPGGQGNIDHLAIGPGGVWVIETKRWTGRVQVGVDRLRHNGCPADDVYDQVWRQAEAVTRWLPPVGVRARPVVCVVEGLISRGRDHAGRPVRSAVEFHDPAGLARRLAAATPVLSPTQVVAVATALDRALPPN